MPRKEKKLETGLENLFVPSAENPAAVESEMPQVNAPPDIPDAGAVADTPFPTDASSAANAPAVASELPAAATSPDAASEVFEMGSAPPSLESPISSELPEEPPASDDWMAEARAVDGMPEEEEDELMVSEEPLGESEDEGAGVERQLVVLMLADEWYGVDIAAVEQIIELQRITPVPHTLPYIAGLINLRGAVLPVLDLRRRLGLPLSEPTRETRIMVTQIRQMQVGMIVDAVTEVLRVSERAIEPPSPLVMPVDSMYIAGIVHVATQDKGRDVDRLLVLLDLEQILPSAKRR
ncbi:MAG TPA: chemotaxis protein CheW [Anaerolineae bacterium]|nr:chemotaxis protein CheW [Anaerolineae bacterium]